MQPSAIQPNVENEPLSPFAALLARSIELREKLPRETPELARGVPPHLLEGLREYGMRHREPGGFLACVLANNLVNAVCYADQDSIKNLRGIVQYVLDVMPERSWGTRDKVSAWLAEGPWTTREILDREG